MSNNPIFSFSRGAIGCPICRSIMTRRGLHPLYFAGDNQLDALGAYYNRVALPAFRHLLPSIRIRRATLDCLPQERQVQQRVDHGINPDGRPVRRRIQPNRFNFMNCISCNKCFVRGESDLCVACEHAFLNI